MRYVYGRYWFVTDAQSKRSLNAVFQWCVPRSVPKVACSVVWDAVMWGDDEGDDNASRCGVVKRGGDASYTSSDQPSLSSSPAK